MNISKNLRIDVGCAATAPNSALWIRNYNNIKILAFEPDFRSFNILKFGGKTNQYPDKPRVILKKKIVTFQKKILKKFKSSTFSIYNCGIDNIKSPTRKNFYYVEKKNYGCSSFKKPIPLKLKINIAMVKKIEVYPLYFFLKKFEKNLIEMLKTDTQGNDLNVLKSARNLIKKILFVQSEYFTNNEYFGEKSKTFERKKIIDYMKKKNFLCYYYTDTDIFFINKKFKKYILNNKILDDCLDFPEGLYRKSLLPGNIDGKYILYCKLRDFIKSILAHFRRSSIFCL
jgi:hypothetical protein